MTNRSGVSSENVEAPLEQTAQALAEPFRDFVNTESSSGWVLLAATVAALTISNSPWAAHYFHILHLEAGLHAGDAAFSMSLLHWINDGVMALFFLLLGLELKREFLVGQLRDIHRAASVICGAVGGMLVPALIFLVLTDTPTVREGWAIPAATDTAFALLVLVLLGHRVPHAARAFVVGLAVMDDLGAMMVIAIAYTSEFDSALLAPALACIAALIGLNLFGVRNGWWYALVGIVLWYLFIRIGLHGTLAGIVVGLAAPVHPAIARGSFIHQMKRKVARFEDKHDDSTDTILEQPEQHAIAHDVQRVASDATAPLQRWETRLQRPVSFVVMPTFAFANAGVELSALGVKAALVSELGVAIAIGLLVGKPLGILAGLKLGQLLGVAEPPKALSWRILLGLGMLGAIGFTMSLFIATLSFGAGSPLLDITKQCAIGTSFLAGVMAYGWLRWGCARPQRQRTGISLQVDDVIL